VFKVIVSPRAWDDFFEIFDYISRDNRNAAARFCDALLQHVDLLGTFPHIGFEIIHFWHTARVNPVI
jgi:plasmid stabilization system protein ParE